MWPALMAVAACRVERDQRLKDEQATAWRLVYLYCYDAPLVDIDDEAEGEVGYYSLEGFFAMLGDQLTVLQIKAAIATLADHNYDDIGETQWRHVNNEARRLSAYSRLYRSLHRDEDDDKRLHRAAVRRIHALNDELRNGRGA